MATDRRTVWVDSSADAVWALIGDPGAIATWFPSIKCCSMTGAKRACELHSGATVIEEIVTRDDVLRRLQYRILSGIALESHLGTVDVIADGGDRCLVVYSTDVMPDHLGPALGGSIERALLRVREVFADR